jgi:uncharacterized protein (TIGR02145 family)
LEIVFLIPLTKSNFLIMKKIITILITCLIYSIAIKSQESTTINVKVFLEGPYFNGQMTPFLNVLGYLPNVQPYNQSPWFYEGDESVVVTPSNDIVDWILIDVVKVIWDEDLAAIELLDRKAGFLLKNGSITDLDAISYLEFNKFIPPPFHIRIHHRNHLNIISATTINEVNGIYSYDFTTGPDKALGNQHSQKQLLAGLWGMISADGNSSGQIDNVDKNDVWLPEFGHTGYYRGDFNMDTQVDQDDKLARWILNVGRGSYPVRDTILPILICGASIITHHGLQYGTILYNGQCWLDRNLGASQVASSYNDPLSYGDLYQWGRLTDGHQLRTSNTTSIISNIDVPGHTDFILADNDPYDWRNPQNDNLWQEVMYINNACPEGWQVPTITQWQDASSGWASRLDAFNSPLKLPSGGWRNESAGNISNADSWGNYWTSTINSAGARGVYFDSFNFSFNTYARASGRSVRCIKTFFTPNNPPNAPSNPNPVDEATAVETDVILSWFCSDPDGDDLTYNIYFGTDPNPTLIQLQYPETYFDPGQLVENTTYHWKIVAYDIYGDSTEGAVWSFTTFNDQWSCGDQFTDDRDGQIYNTVLIGSQCWMAQNLNIGVMINGGTNMTNNGIIEKYCYNNNASNCATYGGLYQWNEIMNYSITPGTQGICPESWYIPTDNEWNILEGTVDSQYGVGDPEWLNENERGFDAGGNLKEVGTSHWNSPNTGATNISGFTSLPGGGRTTGYFSINLNGVYWTSSETGSNAWIHSQYYTKGTSARAPRSKNYAYSIRCIKNINQPPLEPSNPTPPDEATLVDPNITLTWDCSDPNGNELYFSIYFGTNPNPELVATNQPGKFYNPTTLENGIIYYWKIVAYDIIGDSTEGMVWSFTTIEIDWICGDPWLDTRDGNVYNTILIGTQCWMEQNLGYLPSVYPPNQGSFTLPRYYVYDYSGTDVKFAKSTPNYTDFGVLYNWPASLTACPESWHLPSDNEWCTLTQFIDVTVNCNVYDWSGTNVGQKMKSASGWYSGGNGTNSSGFNAFAAGYRSYYNNSFWYMELSSYHWSSNQYNSDDAISRFLKFDQNKIFRNHLRKDYGFSVRCIKN